MCEEACQDLLKYYVSFGGGLEFFDEKNGEATEGRGSIVKCGENPFEEWACENPVELSICDGPIETYNYRKIHLVNIWWMLDCILSQNCRNTLPLHTVDQLGSSAESERLLWLAGMKCVKI